MYESKKWRKHARGALYTFFIGIVHLNLKVQTQFTLLWHKLSFLSPDILYVIIHLEFFFSFFVH